MSNTFNIYCDESCHLKNDHQLVMVLGAVICPSEQVRETSLAIRALKRKYGLADGFEIKWTKISPAKSEFYRALVDWFFTQSHLSFRGLVVPNKGVLRHADFSQTHDDWYYKMYYILLRPILRRHGDCRGFLDIKDTKGSTKVKLLHEYLCRHLGDIEARKFSSIQLVHSDEIACLQLADLLIGALGYVHRDLSSNAGKVVLVDAIRRGSGLTLKYSTAPGRKKFDVFVWEANAGDVAG
jgi:hypothetical protein